MTAITHKDGCAHLYGSPAPPCNCGVVDANGWCFDVEQAPTMQVLAAWKFAGLVAVARNELGIWKIWTPNHWAAQCKPDCWREIAAPEWPEVGK